MAQSIVLIRDDLSDVFDDRTEEAWEKIDFAHNEIDRILDLLGAPSDTKLVRRDGELGIGRGIGARLLYISLFLEKRQHSHSAHTDDAQWQSVLDIPLPKR